MVKKAAKRKVTGKRLGSAGASKPVSPDTKHTSEHTSTQGQHKSTAAHTVSPTPKTPRDTSEGKDDTQDIQDIQATHDATGGVTVDEGNGKDASARARAIASRVFQRLNGAGQWSDGVERTKNDMIAEAKGKGMPAADAKVWAWGELDRMYPDSQKRTIGALLPPSESVRGLGDLPAEWGELAPNASLQAELSWVQANRLLVMAEVGNAIRVELSKASTPAPSMGALSWLETSIRSYAKYVDIVGRSLASAEDEADDVRRERLALDEIRDILRQMHCDDDAE